MNKKNYTGIVIIIAILGFILIWYSISKTINSRNVPTSIIDKKIDNTENSQNTNSSSSGEKKENNNTSIVNTSEKQIQEEILQTISQNSGGLDETLSKLTSDNNFSNKDYYYNLVYYYLVFLYENNPGKVGDKIYPYMESTLKNIDTYEKDEDYKSFLKSYISHMQEVQNATPKLSSNTNVGANPGLNGQKGQPFSTSTGSVISFEDIALSFPEFQTKIEDNLNVKIADYKALFLKVKSGQCDALEDFDFTNNTKKYTYFNLTQNGKFFCNLRKLSFPGSGLSLQWDSKLQSNYIKLPEAKKETSKESNVQIIEKSKK